MDQIWNLPLSPQSWTFSVIGGGGREVSDSQDTCISPNKRLDGLEVRAEEQTHDLDFYSRLWLLAIIKVKYIT